MARLRFDRVAQRFVRDLQTSLRASVPRGKTLIITCTAPIRLASKTAAALTGEMTARLAAVPTRVPPRQTVNGNRIGLRLANAGPEDMPNVLAFVHNPDVDADTICDVAETMLTTAFPRDG